MIDALIVMLGGAFGALSRYSLDKMVKAAVPQFPLGILLANVLGCFLFGLFMGTGLAKDPNAARIRLLITTGFLGAFTTFSTFGYDTFGFLANGRWSMGLFNLSVSVILGLLAVWGGGTMARLFFS